MIASRRHFLIPYFAVLSYCIALFLSLCAHLAAVAMIFSSQHRVVQGWHASSNGSSDFAQFFTAPSENPEFPITIDAAALTTTKTSRFGLFASDTDWDLLPPGDGFIYLPEHDMHYIVSHYHQLHCLRSIRKYFLSRDALSPIDVGHVNHCLIYLRQMVMCNVDVTLEPASHKQLTPDGRVTNAVTGVGVVHRCRNWEQVEEYMVKNYEDWKETYDFDAMSRGNVSTGI